MRVDALIVWSTPPGSRRTARSRHQAEVQVSEAGDTWLERLRVVKVAAPSPRATPPRPSSSAPRRLAEAFISPNTRQAYSGALRRPRRRARRPAARERDVGLLPRRAPRPRPGAGERLDGGGRGVLPGPPHRRAEPGRGTNGPGPRRLPADRRQSGPGASAAVRGGGLRRRPHYLSPWSVFPHECCRYPRSLRRGTIFGTIGYCM